MVDLVHDGQRMNNFSEYRFKLKLNAKYDLFKKNSDQVKIILGSLNLFQSSERLWED